MARADNLVHETSTTTGTGNFTLANVNGKQSFNTAFGNGATTDVFWYFISSRDNAEWEVGTGHMSAATTLVRDTVIQSSNSDAAVNFSAGTADVTSAFPYDKIGEVLLETGSTSGASSKDIDIEPYAADYKHIRILLWNCDSAYNGEDFYFIRCSDNGSSAFAAAVGDYTWVYGYAYEAASDGDGDSDPNYIKFGLYIDGTTNANNKSSSNILFVNPFSDTLRRTVQATSFGAGYSRSSDYSTHGGGAVLDFTAAIDQIRFQSGNGSNISFEYAVYGIQV